jgi:predicted Zn-dependent peptidase
MNRALLIALAGLLMTMGCSQANSPAEHQQRREGPESAQKVANKPESTATLPKYHVRKKKTCQIASQKATCYTVSTHALSGEAFAAFTQHFRKQSGGVANVVVTFFFDEPQANSTGMGFAFKSKEAARSILSRFLAQQKHILQDAELNEEVSKAMQNDGVYVVSVDDEVEQQMCEVWDSNTLGRPPKQWDCPGY